MAAGAASYRGDAALAKLLAAAGSAMTVDDLRELLTGVLAAPEGEDPEAWMVLAAADPAEELRAQLQALKRELAATAVGAVPDHAGRLAALRAELARRAEQAGAQMITVHGRTRCQFFKGNADWDFIARVKAAVSVPVIANGDLQDLADIPAMLRASNADGVMIGRGAYGRPWFPGQAGAFLGTGQDPGAPPLACQREIALEHYEQTLAHYGVELGVRTARKHLGWYVARTIGSPREQHHWRKQLCQQSDPNRVREDLANMFDQQMERAA